MIEEAADDRGAMFCFHNFMISALVCRGKHNNNPSDSVIVSPLRKYSFLAQLGSRWDEKLMPFSLAQSAEARLLEFRGKKSSVTSGCPSSEYS